MPIAKAICVVIVGTLVGGVKGILGTLALSGAGCGGSIFGNVLLVAIRISEFFPIARLRVGCVCDLTFPVIIKSKIEQVATIEIACKFLFYFCTFL